MCVHLPKRAQAILRETEPTGKEMQRPPEQQEELVTDVEDANRMAGQQTQPCSTDTL